MIKKIIKFLFSIAPLLCIRRFLFSLAGYNLGVMVYLPSSLIVSDLSKRRGNITVGDRVSFGPGVTLITDSSPNNSKLLQLYPMNSGTIEIGEDTWIGANVTILPGVKIGKCVIVAAGAVVNHDLDPYTIWGGVPAKLLKVIDKDLL